MTKCTRSTIFTDFPSKLRDPDPKLIIPDPTWPQKISDLKSATLTFAKIKNVVFIQILLHRHTRFMQKRSTHIFSSNCYEYNKIL